MMPIENNMKESQSTSVYVIGLDSTAEEKTDEYHEGISSTAAAGDKIEKEMTPQRESENTKPKGDPSDNAGLPIDKGWAWIVLAGALFCEILFGGIKMNFGIFFMEIQHRFAATATVTSLLVTIQRLTKSFICLITMTVGMQFMSNRTVVMLGALVLTISHIISAFATDIRMLFTSMGVLEGIAKAFIIPPTTVSLLEYFDKRRGLATGLTFSGASLGGVIFAPIFAALFENYGYTGTLMIVAGMTFNFLVTGALLRPIKSFERKASTTTKAIRNTQSFTNIESESDIRDQNTSLENSKDKNPDIQKSFRCKLMAAFDVTMFKTLVFPVYLLMAAMLRTATDLLPVFLAPLSDDIGVAVDQTGILMAVVCGVGLFSKLTCALFADRNYVKLTTLLAVVSTVAGITAHCARFFNSFSLLLVMAVLLGLTCDIYHSLYPVVLVEYVTLPKASSGMGFTVMSQGIAVASTYPIVGWLRDTTGSYNASFHFLGTMSFIGALCALSLPYIHRRSKQG